MKGCSPLLVWGGIQKSRARAQLLQSRAWAPTVSPGQPAYCVAGITPMLQLIRHITKNPRDRTRISLIFANQVGSAESALSSQGWDGWNALFAEPGSAFPPPWLAP